MSRKRVKKRKPDARPAEPEDDPPSENDPPSEEKQAKARENLKRSTAALLSRDKNMMDMILWTGAFHEVDLQRMLRGQLIGGGMFPPCGLSLREKIDLEDPHGDFTEPPERVYNRTLTQLRLEGPLDPIAAPRHLLRCPLEERAQELDRHVPCHEAQGSLPKDPRWDPSRGRLTPEQAALEVVIAVPDITPCSVIFHRACAWLPTILSDHFPLRGVTAIPPDPADLAGRARATIQRAGEVELQTVHEQLGFLLATQRLRLTELLVMLENSLPVTDAAWLPCRDDPQRNLDAEDFADEGGPQPPLARRRCPLHVRALLGDRTVPCIQAQWMDADLDLVKLRLGSTDKRLHLPMLGTWQEDPVRVLALRPCHLLGRLLSLTLYPLLLWEREQSDGQAPQAPGTQEDAWPEEQTL